MRTKERIANRRRNLKTTKADGKERQFVFNFLEQNSGIADDNDISAIVKPKLLDLSSNSVEDSFDMKLLTKTVQGTLTKIDEESAECDSIKRQKSSHLSEMPAGPEENVAQSTFEAELNFSN